MTVTTRILDDYRSAGLKMIRVSRREKRAVDPRWQADNVPFDDIVEWVNRGENVAIQGGPPSGEFTPVDLDAPEARALAPAFLPETLTASKGEEAPSHYVYYAEGMPYIKQKSADGGELLAVKASPKSGHYVVVEPSQHPEKGGYHWNGGFDTTRIARVSAEELERRVGMLGTAALVAQHMPGGDRHDYAKDLCGFLANGDETPDDIEAILKNAWSVRGALTNSASRDIDGLIESTFDRLRAGENVTGGGKLREEIHERLPRLLATTLGWSKGRTTYERTDSGNAQRFVDARGDDFLWVRERGEWIVWDGQRWVEGDAGDVREAAREVMRTIHRDTEMTSDKEEQKAIATFARASQNKVRIDGMMQAVQDKLRVREAELDADPNVLNVRNGTIDLRVGALRPHDRADKITKLAPVTFDPKATAPRFQKFLKQTLPDPELVAFMQRFLGYSLTGRTDERALAVLHGGGKNGKSTLVELFYDLLGDYSGVGNPSVLMRSRYGNDSNTMYLLASLKGARFVSLPESKKGDELEESVVKQITGNDTISARAPYGKPFAYRPQFKLWMSTNHKPEIPEGSEAIWDRIKLVPFKQRFEGKRADTALPEKLREELPGVLAWAVRGAVEWYEHGLGTSEAVEKATAEYREDTDVLERFIRDACTIGPDKWEWARDMTEAYEAWCLDEGTTPLPKSQFVSDLKERGIVKGFEHKRGKKSTFWSGISLVSGEDTPPKSPAKHGGIVDSVYSLPDFSKSAKESTNMREVLEKTPNEYTSTPEGGTTLTFDDWSE